MSDTKPNTIDLAEADPGLIKELVKLVGDRHVSGRTLDRFSYSRDVWPRGYLWLRKGEAPYTPEAVCWPGTEEEVADVVKWCRKNKVPLTPEGGGSGVTGAMIPVQGGVLMDVKRMNSVLSVSKINHSVEAQAGIMGEILERALNQKDFSLGHFPSSIYCSTLGGWLAGRSAGQMSSKYGKIEDMVINISGVLPDGSMFQTNLSPRSAAGPDLDQLIIGSEGTLAVITRAMLAIHPLPKWSELKGYLFEDMEAGINAIRLLMRDGLDPCVVRLYDELDTKLHEKSLLVPGPGCLLIAGFEGPDNPLTRAKAKKGFDICARSGKDLGPGPGEAWFKRRYSVSYHQSTVLAKGNTILDTCEVAAEWSKLMGLYNAMRDAILPHAFLTAHISHVYPTGACIYFTFVSGSEDPPLAEVYETIWNAAMEACIKSGGTISHHHGIGAHKAKWMKAELGPAHKIYRDLKRRLDPDWILNPGKMGLEK